MALNSLKDVYIDQLQDLYSACKQSRDAIEALKSAAHGGELKAALDRGISGTDDGLAALKETLEGHDADPDGEHCKGMEGLVAEAYAHGIDEEFGDRDAQDAMIITQYQRMVYYAIAGYGCCVAFARRLEMEDDASRLQTCLDETAEGDSTMTRIAEGSVNPAAA